MKTAADYPTDCFLSRLGAERRSHRSVARERADEILKDALDRLDRLPAPIAESSIGMIVTELQALQAALKGGSR